MQNIINKIMCIVYQLFSKQIKQSFDIKVYTYFVINNFIIYINLISNNLNIFL